MLPWNYGFHFTTGPIIFMGIFYTVLVIVATTVISAVLRSRRAMREHHTEHIRWHSEFDDLTTPARLCRYALTGEMPGRICPNGFDCRHCDVRAHLVAKLPEAQPAEAVVVVAGMAFPTDRLYHRGHTWVKQEADGTVTVGVDEVAKLILGAPDKIDLPHVGRQLRLNGVAWSVSKGRTTARVLAPLDGKVVAHGGPADNWRLRIRPTDADMSHLLTANEIRPWVTREIQRLHVALAAVGVQTEPGQQHRPDIAANHPDADLDAVCAHMFLHR